MKKIVAVTVFGLMMAATAARAEHKLLITDVLEEKQVEAQAKFEYLHQVGDLRELAETGKKKVNKLESNYSLGVGLGHGLEVTASIPYVLSEREKEAFEVASKYDNKDGVGDFAFGGKYLIVGGEHKPFSLVAGLDLKFDTAGGNNAGTQTTDVSPYLAASTAVGHHLKPYAAYRAALRNHGAEDTHTLTLGAEVELNETVTVDAKFDAAFNTASDNSLLFMKVPDRRGVKSYENYSFELGSYVQLVHNFYLLPSVRVVITSAADTRDGETRFASATGVGGGLSLYYLY